MARKAAVTIKVFQRVTTDTPATDTPAACTYWFFHKDWFMAWDGEDGSPYVTSPKAAWTDASMEKVGWTRIR